LFGALAGSSAETSLVDNSCMYGAQFTMIRADGATEMRKFHATPGAVMKLLTESVCSRGNRTGRFEALAASTASWLLI